MTVPHQFSLRWNNYLRHITLAFDSLRSQEDLVDVTLSCEGRKIRAHKVLLSACSSYFRDIFKENPCQHPVIIFKNVKYEDLQAIIEFMYQGEVNVVQESLPSFLHTAELLSVQGLTDNKEYSTPTVCDTIQIPKLTKIVPTFTATTTASATAQIPIATIGTQRLSFTTTSTTGTNQTPEYIEIQQPVTKKQKIITQQQQESNLAEHLESDEMEYMQQEMKMEMPEYISMETTTAKSNSNIANTSTDVQIQTDEEDALIHQSHGDDGEVEDDDDEKHFMQEDNFEIIHDEEDNAGGSCKEDGEVDPKSNKSDGIETHEIGTVEMSRIFTQTSGESSKVQDGELKFRCSICWKGFKHPNSLTLHKDLHSGKTKCPVCYRAFSRSYDMKTHMTKIHKITFKVETKLNLSDFK